MNDKKEIVICLGSSCFSRGNKQLVKTVDHFLQKHNLNSKVNFRGAHCMEMCDKGPVLKIQDEFFTSVNVTNIIEILSKSLLSE